MFFLLVLSGATYLFARHELKQTIDTNQTATVTGLAGQMDENLAGTRAYLQYLADYLQQHTKKTTVRLPVSGPDGKEG